jgi:serine/threonine protein kinase
MSTCPGEMILRSIGSDALGDATYNAIEEHVEACSDCKALLDSLAHRSTDPALVLPGAKRSPRIPGFEIHHELGRGAMGVVYLATRSGLDRPVALKVLPGAVGSDALAGARRRWLHEARAVSRIRHPNAVPLFDYGEADGWLFLVLEYIPGGTLKRRLTEPIPPRVAAGLVETIARAVAHIHGRGLLHLDLKPSNILLDCDADAPWDTVIPRVSDFGLALFDDPDASETTLAGPRGTPSYMAPEQTDAPSDRIGPTTDIYALGAILYELLTGRPPFQGTSMLETLDQVRGQEPVPPRRLNPAIPRDLETICLTCLRKDPGRRYASAEALAEDLRRWLDGRPISARPASSVEKAWRWCRRRPVVAALAASLAMSLAAGFLGVFSLWRYAEAERGRTETEKARAEADYEVGRAALADILDLGETSIEPTVVVTRDRVIVSLQAARSRILELARRRPDDPAIWKLMALVNLFLGRNFEYQGKWIEGELLYAESLMDWERFLLKNPRDLNAGYRRLQTFQCLARVLEEQGKAGESARYWERAIAEGESVLPRMPDPDFNTMAVCRMELARLRDNQGDHERARTLLQANLDMLQNVPAKARNSEVLRMLVETRSDLLEFGEESDAVSAQDWARRRLGLRGLAPGLNRAAASQILEEGYRFQRSLTHSASFQRRTGKLENARRTADRMHAFGRLLVAGHPDVPVAHLALSLAFVQFAKNAWPINDRAAIERNLSLALEEARQALHLDPQDARARD